MGNLNDSGSEPSRYSDGGLPQKHLPADSGMAVGLGTTNPKVIIGERDGWGKPQPFGISQADERQHIYIIGKTGSGKTTLLKSLILQHIMLGHGVGVIDPHGDLAEELLDLIPRHRSNDLCYFNPSDIEYPVAFNLLANVPKDDRHLVASGIVSTFKAIWHDSWGPRTEYLLYNAVAALLDCQNVSLLGINRMLTDEAYRRKIVSQIKDPFVRAFWAEEYSNYDERFMREAIAPIQNKAGQFLLNPIIRNILGQVKNKVNIPAIMDNGGVFIANLSKGRIGHDKANLLGSLLITQFQLGAMSRAKRPETNRRDFHLNVDEFQNFPTESFPSILSEARKYRFCLVLSHQYIDQLTPSIRQAVFGNVGTLISFRVGYTDAEILEKEFGKAFTASSFADLERFEAIVNLLEDGRNTEPFRAKTYSPLSHHTGRRDTLISLSRNRFATNRIVVEEKLNRWTINN